MRPDMSSCRPEFPYRPEFLCLSQFIPTHPFTCQTRHETHAGLDLKSVLETDMRFHVGLDNSLSLTSNKIAGIRSREFLFDVNDVP